MARRLLSFPDSRLGTSLLALTLLGAGSPLLSQQPDAIEAALKQPILAPGQAEKEVSDYCDAHVPRMPQVGSRSEWRQTAEMLRKEALKRAVYRGEADRWRRAKGQVVWLDTLPGGPGYRIKKLRYEAVPGLWIPALLYEPDNLKGKVPVVLNVNGHDRNGKSADYKQLRCINLAKRGMLALNPEWLGMGQLREGYGHDRINAIDLTGTSGLATFYLAMSRALDLLLEHPNADSKRVAVAGLSGGGWQTIIISSLDPRVTLSNPVAGYSSFRTRARHFTDLGDSEQTPVDLATVADYTHLTAFRAPRPTLLTYNDKDDCCFRTGHALNPLVDAAGPVFRLFDKADNLRTHNNTDPGTHNFLKDNREAFYRMIGDHFYAGDSSYRREEISSEGEVKTAAELDIPLPSNTKTLQSLAIELATDLPRPRERHEDDSRDRLREIVKLKALTVKAESLGTTREEIAITRWRLRMGDWAVPAVEFSPSRPSRTTLVVADAGKVSAAAIVRERVRRGERVIAYDPFSIGEQNTGNYNYLWSLFLSTLGDRPIGLSAGQQIAIAEWARKTGPDAPVQVVADGRRTAVTALVAAGLSNAVGELELRGAPGSLKEIITQQVPFAQAPELFCFGLLKEFDIPELRRLASPRRVHILMGAQTALATDVGWCPCTRH